MVLNLIIAVVRMGCLKICIDIGRLVIDFKFNLINFLRWTIIDDNFPNPGRIRLQQCAYRRRESSRFADGRGASIFRHENGSFQRQASIQTDSGSSQRPRSLASRLLPSGHPAFLCVSLQLLFSCYLPSPCLPTRIFVLSCPLHDPSQSIF